MPTSTVEVPDALPPKLQPCNWPELEAEDALKIWKYYEPFLLQHGYHIMGSESYNTLGSEITLIPPPAADPFHPNITETFIRHDRPKGLCSTRTFSTWQPGVEICFGIDGFQQQIIFKAVMYQSTEFKVLRLLTSPSLRADKCNHIIPVINFLETRDFVIVIMPRWGQCWFLPPSIKLTQGLEWLHEQGVAHADIHPFNIVISHANSHGISLENDFRQTFNLEYAFIDFGSAHQKEYLEGTEPIDVFAADIYNLGKTLETELTAALEEYDKEPLPRQKYEQYRNLLSAMTDPRPES
ncbi:hypothetical protein M422DRAFT_37360 [Sphaerobolus stellatus SS14]|uniref:Protein kinase domain-containing protein n=1 Tax=Sphaerobolus stellatus (strain SS14) TaxID=990650 RepID=A0A0C9UHF3_SPHS4|nr:hypothetical protein M422DRAFT_37360 [Sphaerobolus stellatus SS14]